jgi:hypothetical protein
MIGLSIAEGAHVIDVLPPQNITGGVTGQAFSTKGCAHVSILIQIGAIGAAKPTAILLNQCQGPASNPVNPTAIPFRYYLCKNGSTSQDLLSPPALATASGITAALLSKINNQFIIIELDVAELDSYVSDSNGADYPYLQLQVTDSGNTTFMSALAVLTAERFAYQGGQTATV